jgi:hypothetical protein
VNRNGFAPFFFVLRVAWVKIAAFERFIGQAALP